MGRGPLPLVARAVLLKYGHKVVDGCPTADYDPHIRLSVKLKKFDDCKKCAAFHRNTGQVIFCNTQAIPQKKEEKKEVESVGFHIHSYYWICPECVHINVEEAYDPDRLHQCKECNTRVRAGGMKD